MRLKPYVITFLVLLFLALVIERPFLRRSSKGTVWLSPKDLKEKATELLVVKGEDTLRLFREGQTWMLQLDSLRSVRAEPRVVEGALDELANLEGALVSKSKEKYSIYRVDSAQATFVLVRAGDRPLLSLYIGKRGPSFRGTYLRLDDKGVYLVERFNSGRYRTDPRSWRNRTLTRFARDSLARLEVFRDLDTLRDTLIFERTPEGGWRLVGVEEPVDTLAFRKLYFPLSRLSALNFADTVSMEEAGVEKPRVLVRLTTTDGRVQTLKVGKEAEKNQVYAAVEGDPSLYLVSKFSLNQLFQPKETFLTKEKPGRTEGETEEKPPK